MVISLILVPVLAVVEIGGIAPLFSHLRAMEPNLLSLTAGNTGFALLGFVASWAGIGLAYPGQPHVLTRFMATRNDAELKKGGVVAFIWSNFVFIGAIMTGLGAKVIYGTLIDPEQSLPLLTSELLPPVFGGLVLAAIMSAIWSTADSQLLVMASSVTRDIPRLFHKSDAGHLSDEQVIARDQRFNRIAVAVLLGLAVMSALYENRVIFTFVLYAWSVLGAAFGPPIILGLSWRRTTSAGALSGLITGSIVTVVWKNVDVLSSTIYELVPAFVLSFVAVILVSLVTSDSGDEYEYKR